VKKKLLWAVVIIAILIVGGIVGYKKMYPKPQTQVLETGRVEKGSIRAVLVETGIIKSQVGAVVKIGARATGRLDRMLVKVGDRVKAGQFIARIDDREILKSIEQQKAALQVAQNTLSQVQLTYPQKIREAEANLNYARISHARQQELIRKEYTTRDALDRADNQYRTAEAVLTRLREEALTQESIAGATINEIKAQLQQQEIKLSYTRIYSPISGIIADVTAQEGEMIVAGLQVANLVTVLDPMRLEMWAYIDETDIGRAKKGQMVEYTVDTYPNRTFASSIERINHQPVVKDNIVYYLATVKVASDDAASLRPEMTTHVKIILSEKSDALTVPNAAIKFEKGRQIAYVAKKGSQSVQKVELKLGIRGEERTEILSGLAEGSELATKLVLPVAAGSSGAMKNTQGKKP
jgi:multidrug efflux pump subunit AcrA (membrane-fusion protein)